MSEAIEISTPHGTARLVPGGEWEADRPQLAAQLNEEFLRAYLPSYANARDAVAALGGEVLSPAPEDPEEDEDEDEPLRIH